MINSDQIDIRPVLHAYEVQRQHGAERVKFCLETHPSLARIGSHAFRHIFENRLVFFPTRNLLAQPILSSRMGRLAPALIL